MDITNPQRAKVLVHALPYIQEYSGKIVVIKYGGNAMISAKLKDSVMRDIVLLSLIGVKVVLVHGGGPEITETLEKLGKQTQFVDGLRVTDAETADVVQMVLAGKINKTLVNLIGHKGGRAIGLSGIDGQMIQARVRDERLGYVGEITKVDVRPILDVIDKGYIPVVSTVGCDTQGHVYNINADTAAARIAGELGAESLIAMTDMQRFRDAASEDLDQLETLADHLHARRPGAFATVIGLMRVAPPFVGQVALSLGAREVLADLLEGHDLDLGRADGAARNAGTVQDDADLAHAWHDVGLA